MQFQVKSLALAGEGVLRMQVAALARKLEAEGLMRADRKRPLPAYPQRIAVVTSPRGKAIHDVIRTLRRRYPLAELLVAGVAVEGAGAADEIVEGLQVVAEGNPDVVLLVRGGGSYEDLMPFNAEEVARAVVGCLAPVVTGIGHEPDTSIADMVSDLRASTPTAAAEAVAPSVEEISRRIEKDSHRLGSALQSTLRHSAHKVGAIAGRPLFTEPEAVLGPAAQRIDMLAQSLHGALPGRLQRDQDRLGFARLSLLSLGPRLARPSAEHVRLSSARLDDLSPLKVLGRGYSMTTMSDGRTVVSSTDDVTEGDSIGVRVKDGTIGCRVESVEKEEADV
jgi:exodeoxyribonuclease VII large subunit